MSKHDDNISHFSMTVTNDDMWWANLVGKPFGDSPSFKVRPFGDGLGKFHGNRRTAEAMAVRT